MNVFSVIPCLLIFLGFTTRSRTGGKGPWRHMKQLSGVRGENVQFVDGKCVIANCFMPSLVE